MAANLSWLWLIGAGVLAIGGIALVAWALFADRSRGRKRCAKCWYDMSATAGLKCPECGREARGERGLLRTRRRWWWAVVGVGLLVGAWPVFKAPEIAKRGVGVLVPDVVLVALMSESDLLEYGAIAPTWVMSEFLARPEMRTNGSWAYHWHVERRLKAFGVEQLISFRRELPMGAPVRFSIQNYNWRGLEDRHIVFANPQSHSRIHTAWAGGYHTISDNFPPDILEWTDDTFEIDGVDDHSDVRLDALVYGIRDSDNSERDEKLTEHRMTLPIHRVRDVEQVMRGTANPDFDRAFTQLVRPRLLRLPAAEEESFTWTVGLDAIKIEGDESTKEDWNEPRGVNGALRALMPHPGMTFAVRLEILNDGELVGTGSAWWRWLIDARGRGLLPMRWQENAVPIRFTDASIAESIPSRGGRWTLRMIPDPMLALRDFESTQYWVGDITVPLIIDTTEREP